MKRFSSLLVAIFFSCGVSKTEKEVESWPIDVTVVFHDTISQKFYRNDTLFTNAIRATCVDGANIQFSGYFTYSLPICNIRELELLYQTPDKIARDIWINTRMSFMIAATMYQVSDLFEELLEEPPSRFAHMVWDQCERGWYEIRADSSDRPQIVRDLTGNPKINHRPLYMRAGIQALSFEITKVCVERRIKIDFMGEGRCVEFLNNKLQIVE